jgi:FMN phosphatase YigB (HAD superfamily)
MKTLFVSAFLMLSFVSVTVFAQEESEVVTDEEIAKFAVMEDSVMAFYEKKNEELIDMIRNNEVIEGAGRYNEIKAAWDDEEKLAEIEITEDEKAAYEEILVFMGSLGDEVRELKIELIKNDDILGVATFNKVNKAIKENPEVKEKVESLQAELKEKRSVNEEEESGTGA